jgi:hypothetical protein
MNRGVENITHERVSFVDQKCPVVPESAGTVSM